MTERIGLYPGSFDPITNGHMDIIRRSLKIVDKLIVGIAVNDSKSEYFSTEERLQIIEEDINNMNLSDMRKAVEMCRGRALTEASGRVSIETVSQIAQTGVDMISIGALTHSSRSLDFGLKICA